MLNVGEKIRQIRLERGIDQTTLAERIGVSQAFISQIERGVDIPSLERLHDIAKALNVPVSTFYEDNRVFLNEPSILEHFDEETKKFLAKEDSIPFVRFAKELTQEGVTTEDIATIKEAIQAILRVRNK